MPGVELITVLNSLRHDLEKAHRQALDEERNGSEVSILVTSADIQLQATVVVNEQKEGTVGFSVFGVGLDGNKASSRQHESVVNLSISLDVVNSIDGGRIAVRGSPSE